MDDLNISINIGKLINTYFNLVFKIGLILVILSVFFLFTNLTTESFDTPKFLALTAFTGILLVILTLRFALSGKVTIIRTPLDISLLLLLTTGIVSTILSPSPYVALLGNQLKIHGSLISLIIYVLFYFVLVNSLKNAKEIKWIFGIIIFASQIMATLSLLTYFGINIAPLPAISTTGSFFSTTAILALFIPFMVMGIFSSSKLPLVILNSCFLFLSGAAIALTGTWATWAAALFGLGLTIFISNLGNLKSIKPVPMVALVTPLTLVVLVSLLSFIPPLSGTKNPFYTQSQAFPREIQMPFVASWKISVSAFRDLPFWGTGPASYAFNFTNYKPSEINSTKLWNIRFDTAFNEYMQTLATLGGVGLVALLSLTALFISSAYKACLSDPQNQNNALAVAGLSFFVILALHASSLPLWITGILILASFMALNQRSSLLPVREKLNDFKGMFLKFVSLSTENSSIETFRVDAMPGILLVISLALVLSAGYFGGKVVLADYHHRLALNAVSNNQGITAYNELVLAEKLNPVNDLYRTDLAQTNFALANAIAISKGPTEASPTGSLTDQDKQNIQVLLQQSINEGRIATTLSPRSALNWEILAILYRQISGVAQNALVFSLDAYGRAIQQDPLNPTLRVNVGGVYYAVKNYDLAIRFFTDAINLKSDFANGYYNLSVALKDKGDLLNAQALAEKLVTLIDKDSPDYKVANDYLTDLKNKNTTSQQQPPAAETKGALQQEELPKVLNLPQPEKIATPEAIKKPSPTPNP